MKFVSEKPMRNWYGLDITPGQPFEVPSVLEGKAKATFSEVKTRKKAKSDDEDGD